MRLLPTALLVAGLLAGPAAREEDGAGTLSRDWKQLTTPNLTVVGNAHEQELRRAAAEIERFRGAVATLSSALRLDSPLPFTVVVFRDDSAFDLFKPRVRGKVRDDVAGYFLALPHATYIAMAPTASRTFTYQITFHEYTHYIVNRNLKRLPWWLNEGLADFYGTFAGTERDGRTLIGRPIPHYLGTLRSRSIVPLTRFVSPAETARLLRDSDGTLLMYAQAWALTHYLLVGDNGARRQTLLQFFDRVALGQPPDKVFVDVFGPDLGALDRALEGYVRQLTLPAIQLRADKVPIVTNPVPMPEADALQIQADLLVSLGAFDEAEKRLARALSLDPRHMKARLTRARQRLAEDRAADALDIVSADDIAESTRFDAHFIRAEVLRAREAHTDAIAAYRRAIALNPESAAAYYGMSLVQMATGDPLATASFTICTGLDPSARWYQSRQIAGMRLGIDRFIENDAANVIRMTGWQGDSSAYVMFPAVLTQLRTGRRGDALAKLSEIEAHVEASSWPAAIVAFLRGTMTAQALITKAGQDTGELTEAHAYAGIVASIEGRRDDAIKHLEWVKSKGRRSYREHAFALGELRRLGVRD